MRDRLVGIGWAAVLVAALGGVTGPTGLAQERVTRVDVGYDIGQPGNTVSLPIELTAPEGVSVGTTINAVTFRTSLLTFELARATPSLEGDVTSSVRPDPENKDTSIVEVTVAARKGQALPNGIVAVVTFTIAAKIPEDAKGTTVLKLRNAARALTAANPPSAIDPVTGKDGEIELLDTAPTVNACFFYMH